MMLHTSPTVIRRSERGALHIFGGLIFILVIVALVVLTGYVSRVSLLERRLDILEKQLSNSDTRIKLLEMKSGF